MGFKEKTVGLMGLCWILVGLVTGCESGPVNPVAVSAIQWDCSKRPCQVAFDLHNSGSRPLEVVVAVRGYNTTSDWGPPPPRLFVGKREIRASVAAGSTRHLEVPLKFSRIPKEIEVQVLDFRPAEK